MIVGVARLEDEMDAKYGVGSDARCGNAGESVCGLFIITKAKSVMIWGLAANSSKSSLVFSASRPGGGLRERGWV